MRCLPRCLPRFRRRKTNGHAKHKQGFSDVVISPDAETGSIAALSGSSPSPPSSPRLSEAGSSSTLWGGRPPLSASSSGTLTGINPSSASLQVQGAGGQQTANQGGGPLSIHASTPSSSSYPSHLINPHDTSAVTALTSHLHPNGALDGSTLSLNLSPDRSALRSINTVSNSNNNGAKNSTVEDEIRNNNNNNNNNNNPSFHPSSTAMNGSSTEPIGHSTTTSFHGPATSPTNPSPYGHLPSFSIVEPSIDDGAEVTHPNSEDPTAALIAQLKSAVKAANAAASLPNSPVQSPVKSPSTNAQSLVPASLRAVLEASPTPRSGIETLADDNGSENGSGTTVSEPGSSSESMTESYSRATSTCLDDTFDFDVPHYRTEYVATPGRKNPVTPVKVFVDPAAEARIAARKSASTPRLPRTRSVSMDGTLTDRSRTTIRTAAVAAPKRLPGDDPAADLDDRKEALRAKEAALAREALKLAEAAEQAKAQKEMTRRAKLAAEAEASRKLTQLQTQARQVESQRVSIAKEAASLESYAVYLRNQISRSRPSRNVNGSSYRPRGAAPKTVHTHIHHYHHYLINEPSGRAGSLITPSMSEAEAHSDIIPQHQLASLTNPYTQHHREPVRPVLRKQGPNKRPARALNYNEFAAAMSKGSPPDTEEDNDVPSISVNLYKRTQDLAEDFRQAEDSYAKKHALKRKLQQGPGSPPQTLVATTSRSPPVIPVSLNGRVAEASVRPPAPMQAPRPAPVAMAAPPTVQWQQQQQQQLEHQPVLQSQPPPQPAPMATVSALARRKPHLRIDAPGSTPRPPMSSFVGNENMSPHPQSPAGPQMPPSWSALRSPKSRAPLSPHAPRTPLSAKRPPLSARGPLANLAASYKDDDLLALIDSLGADLATPKSTRQPAMAENASLSTSNDDSDSDFDEEAGEAALMAMLEGIETPKAASIAGGSSTRTPVVSLALH